MVPNSTLFRYMNGSKHPETGHSMYAAGAQLAIGCRPGPTAGALMFRGQLAEVAVYGTALRGSDIRRHYSVGSGLVCSFAITGRNFVEQAWYTCHTCGLVDRTGVCGACKERCHAGHNLSTLPKVSAFYCDCGSGGSCKALKPQPLDEELAAPAQAPEPAQRQRSEFGNWSADAVLAQLPFADALQATDNTTGPERADTDAAGAGAGAGAGAAAQEAHKSTQQVAPNDAAVFVLASLDRLSRPFGAERRASSKPTPATLLEPLAVEVKTSAFRATLQLLGHAAETWLDPAAYAALDAHAQSRVAYAILATLRLLGVNMRQVAQSGLSAEDAGLAAPPPPAGGTTAATSLLDQLRTLLFAFADADTAGSPERLAVAEAASVAVSSGFAVLFPTVVEQAKFLAASLKKASTSGDGRLGPTEARLVDLQVRYRTCMCLLGRA